MGIKLFSISDSSYDEPRVVEKVVYKNSTPDPLKFKILSSVQLGKHVVCEIQYETVSNFEGRKILVYQDTTVGFIESLANIDPHFSDNGDYLSPVARFRPTKEGWHQALLFTSDILKHY